MTPRSRSRRLDVHDQVVGGRPIEHVAEQRDVLAAADIGLAYVGPGQAFDGAPVGSLGDPSQRRVVEHHDLTRPDQAYVELDTGRAFHSGQLEGRVRIFWSRVASATMAQHQRLVTVDTPQSLQQPLPCHVVSS
jgi:hypothetical protein